MNRLAIVNGLRVFTNHTCYVTALTNEGAGPAAVYNDAITAEDGKHICLFICYSSLFVCLFVCVCYNYSICLYTYIYICIRTCTYIYIYVHFRLF